MQLITALRYQQALPIAFVGAGGKTTAIFKAARELLATAAHEQRAKSVLVTTSTHLGTWQSKLADHHLIIKNDRDLQKLRMHIPDGVVLLSGGGTDGLLGGLNEELHTEVAELAEEMQLPLFIEADGSHMHPLKAPGVHEPAIPRFAKVVVSVAGLLGLGKPVDKEWVHRPEKFCEITGLQPGEVITAEAIKKALLNKDGGLRNIPKGARRIALLNQADTPELQAAAGKMAGSLLPGYQAVIIGSLGGNFESRQPTKDGAPAGDSEIQAVIEPTCGIILAAGSSSRFGQPKQLLEWRGEPLVRIVAKTALRAGVSPVIVVLGERSELIEAVIKDLDLRIVINTGWKEGVSSSIRAGLASLDEEVGGAIFLQTDQPQIPDQLIKSLVEKHQMTLHPIVAPQIDGRRGNPVLFDRVTFPALSELTGDLGGELCSAGTRSNGSTGMTQESC